MGVIDDMLAKQRAESPPQPRAVLPVHRYLEPRRIRKKLRGTPSFYLEYFAAVAVEMERQGIPHFNSDRDPKIGGGLLSEAELDQMDGFAERSAPASEFVAWILTQRLDNTRKDDERDVTPV